MLWPVINYYYDYYEYYNYENYMGTMNNGYY